MSSIRSAASQTNFHVIETLETGTATRARPTCMRRALSEHLERVERRADSVRFTPPPSVVLPAGSGEPAAQPLAAPIYAKGPSYWAPPGFEGTAQDPLRLAEEFMSLPEERRGDYFNAVCQFNPMLGSALNSTLRDIRGSLVQRQWLSHMDTLQASTFRIEGLPAWLQGLK